MLIVALIGFHVAGVPGALTAAGAICLPSCTLAYLVEHVWQRFRGTPLRRAVEAGAALAYVNLFGGQDELVFDGASMVFDEGGHLISRAKQFAEDLLVDVALEETGREGRAEEVANLVVYLASDLAHFVNGTMIEIDGGQQKPLMDRFRDR